MLRRHPHMKNSYGSEGCGLVAVYVGIICGCAWVPICAQRLEGESVTPLRSASPSHASRVRQAGTYSSRTLSLSELVLKLSNQLAAVQEHAMHDRAPQLTPVHEGTLVPLNCLPAYTSLCRLAHQRRPTPTTMPHPTTVMKKPGSNALMLVCHGVG